MLIVLTGVLMAYAQAAFASGTSLIYVILRKKKDDENMLEWEDPDFDNFDFEEKEGDGDSGESDESSDADDSGSEGGDDESDKPAASES